MEEKQFDWYTPQKLSPYAFLFIVGKVIKQSWAFLLLFIGGKFLKKEKGIAELGMGYFILIIIGFIVVASIPYVIQYLRFRIFIKGNDLIVLKGLFTKKIITIPINKIQSVHAVQSYLHRFTETCELKIETAGEEDTEVEIKAIDEEKAFALQELLKTKPATNDTIATAEPETILGVGFWDIIKLSISENHAKTFLLILAYLLTKMDDVRNLFGIDTAKTINQEADKINYTTNIILAFTVTVLVITLIVSFIRVLLRYYNMKLKISEKGFETEWGFLQTQRKLLSDSTEHIKELMVMQEMQQPKKTFLLNRGQYDAPAKQVFPNTPEKILPFPSQLPKNRYGLAQWLTDARNPLTARVAVNHLWQNFFGRGLVKTAEDFGNQGEMPSHLDLLDWLAIELRDNNWDIKKLNKLIVMSATYQQDSKASALLNEKDPENKLLARGPSMRLSAEMIRDNALTASGLLNKKLGGKSVYPYQPEGLWEINGTKYNQDSTDQVYRRSLYIVLKRTVPNPTLANFDGPSRASCVVRRQSTNTPLQALVTLNDPTFIEAAKVIGESITKQQNTAAAISKAYQQLTGTTPTTKQMALLNALQQSEYNKFKAYPNKIKGWINTGLYKIDKTLDPYWVAANSVVASTILNSDATITKR